MKRLILAAVVLVAPMLAAQGVMIPTLQVCNTGHASGSANVLLTRRDDLTHSGTMDISLIDVGCDPQSPSPYPTGTITMRFSLTDTTISDMQVTLIEQMTTVGKYTPTTYLNGRCTANSGTIPCHFWLMLADNRSTTADTPADVVGVLVVGKTGSYLAYATGGIRTGDITVTSF
jgi:hypothetical protein